MPLYFTKKLFDKHSVAISGPKGKGKDMLMGNVIARRKAPYYISNTDYCIPKKKHIKLNLNQFMTENRYDNFIRNKIKPYYYPYADNIDIYIADCGIYFPAQYNGELNRDYKDFPTFMALSRHLGNCYVHTNCQAPNRVWDKIREQSDIYITCLSCKVIGKYVFQRIRLYERYDSYVAQIQPFRSMHKLGRGNVERENESHLNYVNTHGRIRDRLLIYKNKTNYDTRLFKTLLEGGE